MKLIEADGKPHLCLFALKEIMAGTEITYDYGGNGPGVKRWVILIFFPYELVSRFKKYSLYFDILIKMKLSVKLCQFHDATEITQYLSLVSANNHNQNTEVTAW